MLQHKRTKTMPMSTLLLCCTATTMILILLSLPTMVQSQTHILGSCANNCTATDKNLFSFCKNFVPAQICNTTDIASREAAVKANFDEMYPFLPWDQNCLDSWKEWACSAAFPACSGTNYFKICYATCDSYTYNCWWRLSLLNFYRQEEAKRKYTYFCEQQAAPKDQTVNCSRKAA